MWQSALPEAAVWRKVSFVLPRQVKSKLDDVQAPPSVRIHIWTPGSLGIRKTPLPHIHGTKALYTSAIPPKLTFPAKCPLATRTIIRAPMDNGWGPVSFYLTVCSFKAALRSPFTDCLTLRFHPPELSVDPHLSATTLLHRFLCLMLFVLYARFSGLSIVF